MKILKDKNKKIQFFQNESILLISDIHLSEDNLKVYNSFINFLRERVLFSSFLYILGDLFDYWVGDDNQSFLHKQISLEFKNLEKNGVTCYFIHGNRDFLLGKNYAKSCRMHLLPWYQILQYLDRKIMILHGDVLCTKDINYQNFRKIVQNKWLQYFFLRLPVKTRIKILEKIKLNINRNFQNRDVDIEKSVVSYFMRHYEVSIIIHGHIHNSGVISIDSNKYRIVLGKWEKNKKSFVALENKKISLIESFS